MGNVTFGNPAPDSEKQYEFIYNVALLCLIFTKFFFIFFENNSQSSNILPYLLILYFFSKLGLYKISAIAFFATLPILVADLVRNINPTALASLSAAAGFLLLHWFFSQRLQDLLRKLSQSEALLKKERVILEESLESKTVKLREVQEEKVKDLYRFAALGRSAAGILHDMASPLSVVSLSLEQLEETQGIRADLKECIYLASSSSKAMERYLISVKKQLQREKEKLWFNPAPEIDTVTKIISVKATKTGILIRYIKSATTFIQGDASKFSQIVSNLATNAVEAYGGREEAGEVIVRTSVGKTYFIVTVKDFGCGIPKDCMKKIWEPFYSTKQSAENSGLGLPTVKEIVEEDFNGKITATSSLSEGTVFKVLIPLSGKGPTGNYP